MSTLFESFMGMKILSDWGIFSQPSIVKQKTSKSALQAILIGHAKYEQVRLSIHNVE